MAGLADLAFAVADDVPRASRCRAQGRRSEAERLASSTSTAAGRGRRKSVAMHVVFQSPERTLTDDDAAAPRADRRGAGRALLAELRA